MKKKLFVGLVIVIAVGGVLGAIKALQIRAIIASASQMVPPPETIASAVVHSEQWPEALTAVGSVKADQGVTVAPEIAGTVTQIAFESGATVEKGDLLVKLDTSLEDAQLRAAEAQAELARLTAERTRKLREDKTVSQSELDNAEAAWKQAQANADAIRATIDKKTIRAPFSGRLGIRLVNLGEQLDVGKAIVSLQSLTPVYVDFSLPQQDLEALQTGLKVRVTTDAYPEKQFEGELTAINPDLNATTRSIQLRAKFANDEKLLRPGMFVNAAVELPGDQNVLAIPSTAILSQPYGDAVYVITPQAANGVTNLIVQQKFIRTGRALGDFTSVISGLQAGDRVVSAGLFKLHNGASVQENNTNSPTASLSPNPPNS
jgi:membrane fusion protein (multidrug efflux system)